jgi:hypothetical protein
MAPSVLARHGNRAARRFKKQPQHTFAMQLATSQEKEICLKKNPQVLHAQV